MLEREKKAQTNEAERSTIRQHCCVHRKIKMLFDFAIICCEDRKIKLQQKAHSFVCSTRIATSKALERKAQQTSAAAVKTSSEIMRLYGWKL